MHWTVEEAQNLKESYEKELTLESVLRSINGRSKDSAKIQLYKLIKSGFIVKRNNFIKTHIENPIYTKNGKIINGSNKKWWTEEETKLLRKQWLEDMDFNIPDRTKSACNRKAITMRLVVRKKRKRDGEEASDEGEIDEEVEEKRTKEKQKREAAKIERKKAKKQAANAETEAAKAETEAAKEVAKAKRAAEKEVAKESAKAKRAAEKKTKRNVKIVSKAEIEAEIKAEREAAKAEREAAKVKKKANIDKLGQEIRKLKGLAKKSELADKLKRIKEQNIWTREETLKLIELCRNNMPIDELCTQFPNNSKEFIQYKQKYILKKKDKTSNINWWTKEETQKLISLTNAKTPISTISTEFLNRSMRAIECKQTILRKRGMLEEESLVGNWSDNDCDDFDDYDAFGNCGVFSDYEDTICVDNCIDVDNCVDVDNCIDFDNFGGFDNFGDVSNFEDTIFVSDFDNFESTMCVSSVGATITTPDDFENTICL